MINLANIPKINISFDLLNNTSKNADGLIIIDIAPKRILMDIKKNTTISGNGEV